MRSSREVTARKSRTRIICCFFTAASHGCLNKYIYIHICINTLFSHYCVQIDVFKQIYTGGGSY